jgi:hypothetical protein
MVMGLGFFAPGGCEGETSRCYLAAHHQILAHAAAVDVYRRKFKVFFLVFISVLFWGKDSSAGKYTNYHSSRLAVVLLLLHSSEFGSPASFLHANIFEILVTTSLEKHTIHLIFNQYFKCWLGIDAGKVFVMCICYP